METAIFRKALPEHFYGCKLMNGSIVYYRQDQPNEILLGRLGKISNPLPPLPIRFAGELDNLVYFYTLCSETETYSFYKLWWDESHVPAVTEFEHIGQMNTYKEARFALQQPYFLDFTDEPVTINKFGSDIERTFSRETSGVLRGFESFCFFMWRGAAVIVREAEKGALTSVSDDVWYNGEIFVVAIEHGLPPATSVYAQRGSLLYLLCGTTIFVFNDDFLFLSYKIERPKCLIGGAETRRLYLNENKLFFSHDLPEVLPEEQKPVVDQESKILEVQALSETYDQLNSAQHEDSSNIEEYFSRFARDFEVYDILGTGGYIKDKRGTRVVFGALSNEDNVKRIAVDPRYKAMVNEEVLIMAALEHPGIVRYHTTWCEEPPANWQYATDVLLVDRLERTGRYELMNYGPNSVFIYMQMQLANSDLAKWLRSHLTAESRPLSKMKQFFKQMVSAVDYLHQKMLIHRDLKPAIVLLFDGDILKLCDMGIVIKNNIGLEESHTGSGTKPYMSPEQNCAFPQLNFKTDIFSLGLILTELCIVMEGNVKYEIFDNFRNGVQNTAYRKLNGVDEETESMINRLTNINKNMRPHCGQILEDPFLSNFNIPYF